MPGSAQRVDDVLSLPELLAIIQDLYQQLQALDSDTSTARYKRSAEYVRLEGVIRSYARQVWARTEGSV